MRIAPFLAGFRNRSTSAALAVAAAVMLVLANLFPVLATETSGSNRTDTIFSGAMELGHQGLWPIAAIVFSASILIPVLKLAGLACLLLGPHGGARAHSRKFTRIYAAIDFIGRWSMLDVFLAAFLVGHVLFIGGLLQPPSPAGTPPFSFSTLGLVVAAVVVVAVEAAPCTILVRSLADHGRRALIAPVCLYVLAIAVMVVLATNVGILLAALGAGLFLLSDTLLALDRFVRPIRRGPLAVHVTYHLAQGLLVLSLLR